MSVIYKAHVYHDKTGYIHGLQSSKYPGRKFSAYFDAQGVLTSADNISIYNPTKWRSVQKNKEQWAEIQRLVNVHLYVVGDWEGRVLINKNAK